MIYHDPTEARPRTKVTPSTLAISRPLENLERFTGADFLIDPFDDMPLPLKIENIPPHLIALSNHCQDGILIQRKSGRDLLNSIAELEAIQGRMQAVSGQAWLVPVGVAKSGENGVSVYGRKIARWRWASIQGAFSAWRLRGGSVVPEIKTDEDLTKFFSQVDRKVNEYFRDKTRDVAMKSHIQSVNLVDRNWLNTLSAWPTGIGTKHLTAIAKHIAQHKYEPSLINVARFILSGQAEIVHGWGPKMIASCREWFGVDQDRPLETMVINLNTGQESTITADNLKPRRNL